MVPQVSVRWGSSVRPCHLAFPRSHLPEPLYTVSQGSGVWLPALLLEFALTMPLVCPAPWRMRNHRQQKPLEVTPNRASGLGSPLRLSSFLLPCSSDLQCYSMIFGAGVGPKDSGPRPSRSYIPCHSHVIDEPALEEFGFTYIEFRLHRWLSR